VLTRVDDLLRTSNNKSVGFSGKCQNSRSVAAMMYIRPKLPADENCFYLFSLFFSFCRM
jgi:hypothetical protein